MTRQLISLSGYARSGKDEVAKILVEEAGFTRIAFADKLREVLYALNPIVRQDWKMMMSGDLDATTVYLQQVVDYYTWDNYKDSDFGPEIRRLLQRLGTEAGRQTLYDSIWVDAAIKTSLDYDKVVISDARFPNELQAVRERWGLNIKVNRPGVGAYNGHPSENSVDTWRFDYEIENDGTLDDLRDKVIVLASELAIA